MRPSHVHPWLEPQEGAVLCHSKEAGSLHRRRSLSPGSAGLHPEVWSAAIVDLLPRNMTPESEFPDRKAEWMIDHVS